MALAKEFGLKKMFPANCNASLKCMVLAMGGKLSAEILQKNGLTMEHALSCDIIVVD